MPRRHVEMGDVRAGKAELPLEIGRAPEAALDDEVLDARHVLAEHLDTVLSESLALGVPAPFRQLQRGVKDVRAQDVLSGRGERGIGDCGEEAPEHRLSRDQRPYFASSKARSWYSMLGAMRN